MIRRFKQIFQIINWPILFILGQFFLIILFALIFQIKEYHILFPPEMNTENYNQLFQQFINDYKIIIVLLNALIFFPFINKQYQKVKSVKNNKLNPKDILLLLLMGSSFSIIFNSIIFTLNDIIPIESYTKPSNILTLFVATCLIGPIMEEYLYRGIVYERLKRMTTPMKAILLTTIIFGLVHSGMIGILYAMIINFMFIYVYELYSNLKASIIFHISANTSILLLGNLLNSYWYYKEIALILSIIILVVCYNQTKIKYAKEVSYQLHIPLLISYGSKDIDNIIQYIMNWR